MSKFKIGDKVRYVRELVCDTGNIFHFTHGKVYTVCKTDKDGVYVRDDKNYLCYRLDFRFQPVTDRYIIAVEENGKFAPAKTPREFVSLEEATRVAERMTKKHGKLFYVLKAVAVSRPKEVKTIDAITEVL